MTKKKMLALLNRMIECEKEYIEQSKSDSEIQKLNGRIEGLDLAKVLVYNYRIMNIVDGRIKYEGCELLDANGEKRNPKYEQIKKIIIGR